MLAGSLNPAPILGDAPSDMVHNLDKTPPSPTRSRTSPCVEAVRSSILGDHRRSPLRSIVNSSAPILPDPVRQDFLSAPVPIVRTHAPAPIPLATSAAEMVADDGPLTLLGNS